MDVDKAPPAGVASSTGTVLGEKRKAETEEDGSGGAQKKVKTGESIYGQLYLSVH